MVGYCGIGLTGIEACGYDGDLFGKLLSRHNGDLGCWMFGDLGFEDWDIFVLFLGSGCADGFHRGRRKVSFKVVKGKTRHFCLAPPLHNLEQKAASVLAQDWSFVVSETAAKASVLLSTFLDDTFAMLDILPDGQWRWCWVIGVPRGHTRSLGYSSCAASCHSRGLVKPQKRIHGPI